MDSVRQIAQRFGIQGVHGPLYELFEVDDILRTAVEVTAGTRSVGGARVVCVGGGRLDLRTLTGGRARPPYASIAVVNAHSLFHVVVDTDETAQRVLDVMNREKSGRITFMPLNRLRSKAVPYPTASTEAFPLIKKLKYQDVYATAMQQVPSRAAPPTHTHTTHPAAGVPR